MQGEEQLGVSLENWLVKIPYLRSDMPSNCPMISWRVLERRLVMSFLLRIVWRVVPSVGV